MTEPSVEVRSALICDEVRREYSGRSSIMGVMAIGPEIHEGNPRLERLGLYVEAVMQNVEKVDIRLWSEEHEAAMIETAFEVGSRADFEKDNPETKFEDTKLLNAMVINQVSFDVPGGGIYYLQIKSSDEDKWQTAHEFYFPVVDI